MKQITTILVFLALTVSVQAQKITALPAVTSAADASLIIVRSGASGDVLSGITVSNLCKDRTFTGTLALPTPFSLGGTSVTANAAEINVLDGIPGTLTATELGYVDGTRSSIQEQLDDTIEIDIGSNLLNELQALGFTGVAIPVAASLVLGDYVDMTDGTAYYQTFYLPEPQTITGVRFVQRVAGVYTADNYNGVALYSVSGTTYTRVAQSTDDGDLWKGTAYTLITKAFSAPYSAAAGVYVVGILYNTSSQSTAPSIYNWNATSGVSQLFLTNRIAGTVASQTELPASETNGDLTTYNEIVGIWLY